MITAAEICDRLRELAPSLGPDLLPNGRRAGNKWMFSGIADTGQSESAWLELSGPKIGKWFDMGNAAPGEDKGDMLDLLRLKGGYASAADALQEAKRILGIEDRWTGLPQERSQEEIARRAAEAQERARKRDEAAEKDREARSRGAKALYLKGQPSIVGTPAEAYLVARGLEPGETGWPGVLRFFPEVWCTETRVKEPAMLAAIYNAAGEQTAIHITFLQRTRGTWTKLDIPRPKIVRGPAKGGFIPINKGASGKSMRSIPEGEMVNATEGIEKGISIRMLRPAFRIISTMNLVNMGAIILPPAAKRLHLVCDRDESETAQGQLERSIAQQQARGLDVKWTMPPPPFKDIDEWMLAWRAQERAARGAA